MKKNYRDLPNFNIRLPRDLIDKIRLLAVLQGKNISELGREIIESYIDNYIAEQGNVVNIYYK